MLPTCKQVTKQLSDNLDEPMSGLKWLKLKFHLLMCVYCRLYAKQIEISSQVIQKTDINLIPSESFEREMLQNFKEYQRNRDD